VAWGGRCHPQATGCQHFATPWNFLQIFYRWFVFATKERSPEIVVELKLGLCGIQKAQSFPFHTLSILSI